MNLVKRATAPTPKFFKSLRAIGLSLTGLGGVLMTSAVDLPLPADSIGGYLAVAGGVLSAVSQLATQNDY